MHSFIERIQQRALSFLISCAGLMICLAPATVQAHGAPEYPISRQYNCYLNPKLPACAAAVAFGGQQALYDWNGVLQPNAAGNHQAVVPDGKLCAGGNTLFRGFDLARDDWMPTAWVPNASGLYEFRYFATAPHRSQYWRFYLTRQGWTPSSTLRWADLDLVAELNSSQIVTTAANRYVMQLNIPPRTGRHVLFAVWQRSDLGEAFYSCSDVTLGSSGVTASQFQQIGQVDALEDLPIGSTVKLRVFDRTGSDLESHSLVTTSANRLASLWLSELAIISNRSSAAVRLGELQGGQIIVPVGRTQLQVYATTQNSGIRFAVDKTLPTNVTGPAGASVWTEGQSYAVGQVVTHNGKTYRCILAHTAWVGANWKPDVSWTQNVLWVNVVSTDSTSLSQPIPWVDGQAYRVGQLVIYNGKLYRCKVAHTAWLNAGWRPDVAWVLAAFWEAL